MVEIMDTTLRDGEQTYGVSFTINEKLNIAKILLGDVRVDRIEVASARVSEGEKESIKKMCEWAKENKKLSKIEVLGFVDHDKSVDWINETGCKVINLLCKGSLKHLTVQLKKTKEQHLEDIKKTVEYANSKGIRVNVYLEDWSNGMKDSKEYVYYMIDNLTKINIDRIMLPDTLGILHPEEIYNFIKELKERFDFRFDFHAHNDYGLATMNTFRAVEAGIDGVHVTTNGLGERAGNAPLDEVVVGLKDLFNEELKLNEAKLDMLSKMVERFSGIRIASNKPISGGNVFTQTAGVHADGDKKGNLYCNRLLPERFGRERTYSLGKLMGKASLEYNLKRLGIDLGPEEKKLVMEKIVELGDKKKMITTDDLPYIISEVLQKPQQKKVTIESCKVISTLGEVANTKIRLNYKGDIVELGAEGDGGYDAAMNAIRKIFEKYKIELPGLKDYEVHIPPGGKTSALVEATVTWFDKGKQFKTKGVDSDQVMAAIKATENMLNIVL